MQNWRSKMCMAWKRWYKIYVEKNNPSSEKMESWVRRSGRSGNTVPFYRFILESSMHRKGNLGDALETRPPVRILQPLRDGSWWKHFGQGARALRKVPRRKKTENVTENSLSLNIFFFFANKWPGKVLSVTWLLIGGERQKRFTSLQGAENKTWNPKFERKVGQALCRQKNSFKCQRFGRSRITFQGCVVVAFWWNWDSGIFPNPVMY